MKNYITKKKFKNIMTKKLISYASKTACVAFLLAAILLANITSAVAKVASKDSLLQQYSSDLGKIEGYLNSIQNLTARFLQETSEGNSAEGKLYLSRPGKMRVEYNGQQKVLIVVNGSVLTYTDLELDETSYLTTNSTPASFLTRPNISFSAKDVEITDVKKTNDQIKISVMKKNRKEAGEFSLIFSNNPLRFIKMEVKNELDQITSITFKDSDFSKPISNNLFVIKNKNLPE